MIRQFAAIALALFALGPAAPARADEPVDLLLVLAADVSRSIDQDKFQLQREGYAAAVADPRVLRAIASGPNRRIAICFVEWSGMTAQQVVIAWTLIDGSAPARRFGDQILEAPRAFADRTSISAGIDFAAAQFEHTPYASSRRIIDVSGDGTNNSGRPVTTARDEALAKGLTINGLVILSDHPMPWNPEHTNPPGGLKRYYQDNVVGGPGAFVLTAANFEAFEQAMVNKLTAEIAQGGSPADAAWRAAAASR